jgi:hypothetical protein
MKKLLDLLEYLEATTGIKPGLDDVEDSSRWDKEKVSL